MIYIASKAKHYELWLDYRNRLGFPIISTWIDEAAPGATVDWKDLWQRCVAEARACDVLICYHQPGEALKGALVEIGAALSANKPVILVGAPDGSWPKHPLIRRTSGIDRAFADAMSLITAEAL